MGTWVWEPPYTRRDTEAFEAVERDFDDGEEDRADARL